MSPRRALVVRAGALGDVLLLRRAAAALQAASLQVTLLAPERSGVAMVGDGPGDVSLLLPFDDPGVGELLVDGAFAPGRFRDALLECEVAIVYSRSTDLVRGLGRLIPRTLPRDPQPDPARGLHASHWLLEALAALGITRNDDPPVCRPNPTEAAEAEPLLRRLPLRFLAIHPGSGSTAKNWPADRFDALVGDRTDSFLIVKGPADAASVGGLSAKPNAVIAEGLPARVLGAVLARAAAYVGNDSGVSHLAAAWGAPTVALFGPTDPGLWAPVGPRVEIVRSPNASMQDIAVDDVRAAIAAVSRR